MDQLAYIVLVANHFNPAWKDGFDSSTGIYTYYGDQNTPGKKVTDTTLKGNLILTNVFDNLHHHNFLDIPPFFIFEGVEKKNRTARFIGLAVPGNPSIQFGDDLVLSTVDNLNNYIAKFTVLDTRDSNITYEWLEKRIYEWHNSNKYAPEAWKNFTANGLAGITPFVK